jgi:hypothetical protein
MSKTKLNNERNTKTKGFCYDPVKDKAVIDHIDSQQNGSQYIWELVRKDMTENNIEEVVRKQIEKYLQGLELSTGNNKKTIDINENDIKDILGM